MPDYSIPQQHRAPLMWVVKVALGAAAGAGLAIMMLWWVDAPFLVMLGIMTLMVSFIVLAVSVLGLLVAWLKIVMETLRLDQRTQRLRRNEARLGATHNTP